MFLLGTENAMGGVGLWQCMPSCFVQNGGLWRKVSFVKKSCLIPKNKFYIFFNFLSDPLFGAYHGSHKGQ